MSIGAILFGILTAVILYGGLGVCLYIALKRNDD